MEVILSGGNSNAAPRADDFTGSMNNLVCSNLLLQQEALLHRFIKQLAAL